MNENQEKEPILYEIIWMAESDFKTAMIVLKNAWKYSGQETFAEAEELEEDEIDYDDDEYYAVVEYYDHDDGSSVGVYYADEEKKEISDIRFWMAIDEDEREVLFRLQGTASRVGSGQGGRYPCHHHGSVQGVPVPEGTEQSLTICIILGFK